jgi:Mycothiol maleylpyruvate isomerase N-terminal domain
VNEVRVAYLEAAAVAADLVANPELAHRWDQDGACEGMTVGAIATHLIQSGMDMLVQCVETDEPPVSTRILDPARYYSGQSLDLEHEGHRAVRAASVAAAADRDAEDVRSDALVALEILTKRFSEESDDRQVLVLDKFTMTLDGLVVTRLVELLAHTDDLAASLGLVVEPPSAALAIVASCLTDVARRRHGDLAVLRALARGGRNTVEVFPVF